MKWRRIKAGYYELQDADGLLFAVAERSTAWHGWWWWCTWGYSDPVSDIAQSLKSAQRDAETVVRRSQWNVESYK
ncbi:MAG: hypothetical protein IPH07_23825 [Deltaproteobacteria bacterium]|nr:hypothetical protein [Deltaproteobacteria bacterium]